MEEGSARDMAPAMATIHVTHEAIGEIVAQTAKDVVGVSHLGGTLASGLTEILGKRANTRGVRVDLDNRLVSIAVYMVVKYGVRIPDVAQRAQEQIKQQVEYATGLSVKSVDIHIQGIALPTDTPEAYDSPLNR